MVAFLTRAGSGVPGDITRPLTSVIESGFLDKTALILPTRFGIPLVRTTGGPTVLFKPFQPGNEQTDFYGILTRLAPSISGDLNQSFGSGTPNLQNVQGIGVKGYFNVIAKGGVPVRGNSVYICLVAAPGFDVGDLGDNTMGGTIAPLFGVVWATDGKDSNGVAEISVKS